MPVGQMRERVTLQSESRTPDGQGGAALAWTDVATVWARVEPTHGREQRAAMQVQAEQVYTVTIRYRADVTSKMRLQWGGKILNIRSVTNPDENRRFMELLAEEGVGT